MPTNQTQNMYANAQIPCSVFVVPDTHANSVKKATGATVLPIGISQNFARTRPDPDFNQSTQAQQIAANAGETLLVFTQGATGVDLVCAEAWNPGDLIVSDANGAGIVATTGTYYGARAQGTGVIGALCPVDLISGYKA